MNVKFKKLLSLLLTMTMVLGMSPISTIAADGDAGAPVVDPADPGTPAGIDSAIEDQSEETTAVPALTSVAPVVQIGEQDYATLADALAAAQAMTGDVVVTIYDKVTLNVPLFGSYSSIKFVGADADAEIYLDVQGYITATGKSVAFENLILSKSAGGFIANAGFMNVAFGVYDVANVSYTNCTFANGAYASSGAVTFNGCTFYRSHDKYGLWAYGDADITVTSCDFVDYRGIKMYAENGANASTAKPALTVQSTTFTGVTDKPAIVLTYGESVTLNGNTYSSTGTFELDLDGAPNGVSVTSSDKITCKNDNGACGVLVDGKIYTTVAQAAEVAVRGSTVVLLHESAEKVALAEGVVLNKNGFTAADVTVVTSEAYVATYDELLAALSNSAITTIYMTENITAQATQSSGYGKAGIVLNAGKTLDGQSHTLTITGAGATWDCAIAMLGGTVQNLTIADAMRGVFMPGANGDVVIDNCKFENVIYTFNSDAGDKNYSVTIKNTTLNGWTSFSNVHGAVKFDNCSFGEGCGYAYIRPYQATTFTDCNFDAGFKFDATQTTDNSLALDRCTYAGEAITAENAGDLFFNGGFVVVDDAVVDFTKYAAKINGVGYNTLEEAFAAAQADDTIVLFADAAPALKSQRAITKAAVIDLNGNTLTLTEDDLYFGTTTFQNGTIVVDPSVKASTAVFWMFADQTLTFDAVKVVATGVTGTYLIGLDGNNSDLNLLNGSEIYVNNDTALDLDIICVNASTGNDIVIENSKVNVTNLDGRVFFRGNYTVSGNSDIDLAGITKAGFRIEKGQTLSIEDTAVVTIVGEPLDGGIHLTDVTATYTKADTATVVSSLNAPVALVGTTSYASLTAAFAAANDGTVTLVSDIALTESVTVNGTVTLDLNGKIITGTDNSTGSFGLINITPGANLTINDTIGDGAITLRATNNRGWGGYSSVISNQRGTLIVNGGALVHLGGTDMAYAIDNLTNTGAEVAETTINGGTIQSTYRAIRQFLNSTSAGVDNILTVNGGTIEGGNKSIWVQNANAGNNPGTLTVTAGTLKGDVMLSGAGATELDLEVSIAASALFEGSKVTTSNADAFKLTETNGFIGFAPDPAYGMVAMIGETYYATLAEAVKAVPANTETTTIVLLQNISLNNLMVGHSIPQIITIDLNGNTISSADKAITSYRSGTVLTLTNGTITGNSSGGTINVSYGGKLVLENITVKSGGSATALRVDNGSVTIGKGTTVIGGTKTDRNAITLIQGNVTIEAGDLTGAITAATGTTLTITGGTFSHDVSGYVAKGYECEKNGSKYNVVAAIPGTGSVEDPFVIETLEDLIYFRDSVNAGETTYNQPRVYVVLGADIDLDNKEWTPIGTSTVPFKGVFDGNNKTISNLLITGYNSNVGLFGQTVDGEIKNLTINNAKVSGRLNVAVVTGTPYTSKYTNIKVTGHVEVNGMAYVGGVGGKNAYADWTNITVDVDAASYVKADSVENGNAYRTYVGGVIGFNGEGSHTFKNITSNINVIGSVCDVGGIFGIAHYGNNFENITCAGNVKNTSSDPEAVLETGLIAGVWHNELGTTVSFNKISATGTISVPNVQDVVFVNGGLIGNAYNADNVTVDTSGSLKINGAEAWLKSYVAQIGDTKYISLQAAIEDAADDETITLLANIDLANCTPVLLANSYNTYFKVEEKTVTIDMNGKTISGAYTDAANMLVGVFSTDNNGHLTLKNGTVNVTATGTVYALIVNYEAGCSITIENGTYTLDAASDSLVYTGGNEGIIVNGGTFTLGNVGQGPKGNGSPWIFNGYGSNVNHVVVTGGSFNANIANQYWRHEVLVVDENGDPAAVVEEDGRFIVTDAEAYVGVLSDGYNYNVGYTTVDAALAAIKAGNGAFLGLVKRNAALALDMSLTLKNSARAASIVLRDSAVVLTADADLEGIVTVSSELAAGSYDVKVSAADGVYTYSVVRYVAQIDETKYASLQEAIDAAANDAEIKLIANIDLADYELVGLDENKYNTYFKVEDKTVTIDMNGKTISGEYAGDSMLVGVFSTDNNGHLTLTGDGTVDVTATGTVYALIVNYEAGCSITIENGTYTLDAASDSLAYTGGNEGIIVNGGTFTLGNVGAGQNGMPWIFNAKGQHENHVLVNGGTFNADVNHQYWCFEVEIAEGKALKADGEGYWSFADAVASVNEQVLIGLQWYTRTVNYATLEEAIAAVESHEAVKNQTNEPKEEYVTLLVDFTASDVVEITKAVTIDFNNHTAPYFKFTGKVTFTPAN